MWSFRTSGDEEQATGFDATFDGPVEDAGAALAHVAQKAAELAPQARTICQTVLDLIVGLAKDTANGKRRLSVNLTGGAGKQLAWSFNAQVNLAEDPEAR